MFDFIKKVAGFGSNDELEQYIKGGALLVDVRTQGEFNGGSVSGAINIPLDTLERQLNKLPKDKAIVVFCRSGMRSGQAKQVLNNNGYKQVINGGSWQNVAKSVNK
ncbi:rhodanese-like domain-containing protein [Myroides phaeus]|uniref:Rhodanese-like domain-containing protein n=1 Tax=Myroides phaeus TaxID=702745 RepID=A0A1G8FJZ4_9FLAO|nr:rhodanese-like domain-containing protein [Myroides phaeus]SDH82431.1 Rhodanese-like domain-containing protein [Myroides phaeus]